jgi:hypothetical protein
VELDGGKESIADAVPSVAKASLNGYLLSGLTVEMISQSAHDYVLIVGPLSLKGKPYRKVQVGGELGNSLGISTKSTEQGNLLIFNESLVWLG